MSCISCNQALENKPENCYTAPYCKGCKATAISVAQLRDKCTCLIGFQPFSASLGTFCRSCAKQKFEIVPMACNCCKRKMVGRFDACLCVKCKTYTCWTAGRNTFCFHCQKSIRQCSCKAPQRMSLCCECTDDEIEDVIMMYFENNFCVKGGIPQVYKE